MGRFFKIFPIGSNLRKIKSGYFAQNLAQNPADWYMNGSLFLKKFIYVWVYFQISWRPYQNQTWVPPPPSSHSSTRVPSMVRYTDCAVATTVLHFDSYETHIPGKDPQRNLHVHFAKIGLNQLHGKNLLILAENCWKLYCVSQKKRAPTYGVQSNKFCFEYWSNIHIIWMPQG